jgi:hypothetical protein
MKTIRHLTPWSVSIATALLSLSPAIGQVSLPFTDNFDSDTVGGTDPSFTTSSTYSSTLTNPKNSWSVVTPGIGGSGNGFQSTIANNSSTIYSAATVRTAAGSLSQGFTLSSDFNLETIPGTGARRSHIGLAAFGSVANLGVVGETGNNTTTCGIWPELELSYTSGSQASSTVGSLGFVNFRNGGGNNGNITIGTQSGANLAIDLTDTYTLSLAGNYDGSGDLTLLFTATDDTTSATASLSETVSASIMSSYYSGNNFGIMDRLDASGTGSPVQSEQVLQDNFSLTAVPEPSVGCLLLAGLGALRVARRACIAKRSMVA